MSEGKYQRSEFRFDNDGLGLSTPTDQSQQSGHFPILVNVRQLLRGTIRQRPGLNSFLTAPNNLTPWHSLRRLNDRSVPDYAYIAGIGTEVATGKTGTLTSRDTGYSGNPLTMLPFKPPGDRYEWMAVADTNKMRKFRYDGTVRTLGLTPPSAQPVAELDFANGPLTKVIDSGNSTASWSNGANGETPGTNARIATTYGAAQEQWAGEDPLDIVTTGGPGWFSWHLTSLANITPGTVLTDSGTSATLLVEEIHPGSPSGAGCTVERIIGDNGTTSAVTSWATIAPSVALNELQPHAIVQFGAGANYGVVQHRTEGPDGRISFRCLLTAAVSAGDAITVLPSVYGYATGTVTGPNVTGNGVWWQALDASSTNNITKGSGGSPLNLNLSSFSTGGRRVDWERDELVCAVYLSDPSRLAELKLEIDVDSGSFDENYNTRSVSPDELVAVTRNTITATDNRATEIRRQLQDRTLIRDLHLGASPRDIRLGAIENNPENMTDRPRDINDSGPALDDPGAATSRTSSGNSQWFAVRFKLSDWLRVGEDKHVGPHNVIALRFVVIVTSGGTLDFGFDDWQIVGGYEPDVSTGAPYEYSYRFVNSVTGERSNWSPPSRSVVYPHRYQVNVRCPGTNQTGVDRIDIRRRGGFVNEWRIIGRDVSAIAASVTNFKDVYSDEYALGVGMNPSALEGNTNTRPFTIERESLTITNALVAGPIAYDSGGAFNTNLAHGTPLMVNKVPTLLKRVISANVIELYDHCGSSSTATVQFPKQILADQPLPVIFGTLDGWSFALGDQYNPGRLYFFNHGTLDSTRSSYWLDVSDSSAALLNGCVFNGRAYVWTSEGMHVISFSGDEDIFRSDPVTGGVGLYARWALVVGDAMYWLGKDGIYTSDGGVAINIVRRDLLPLFSNEGQTGATTNTIPAPHMPQNASTAQIADLRLGYAHNKFLYFDYKDSGGTRRTLVLDRGLGEQSSWGWYSDVYTPGAVYHYADEGEGVRNIIVCGANSPTSQAYTLGGAVRTDAGTSFSCQVRSLALDGADLRSDKLFGDGFVDVDPANGSITPTFYFDNFTSNTAGSAITGAARVSPPTLVDFGATVGAGQYARNIALDLQWTVNGDTVAPTLYGWGFSWMGRPEETIKRATDYSDLGHWGPKELKGMSMEIDTKGVARDIVIEYTKEDGTVATISKTVTTGQKDLVQLSWDPVVCFEARIRPTDTDRWRYYDTLQWHYEPLTGMTPMIGDWFHFNRAVWVQGVEIDGDTNNAIVSTVIQRDFSEAIRTISCQHNGRGTKAYSFDPPFIAYMVRTAPAAAFRRMKERWLWKPEAPIGTVWEAQEFELGDPYGTARQVEVEYAAGATVTLKYYVDGTLVLTEASTLVSTGNTETYRKRCIDLPAVKGRLGKVRLECSTGVRVRQNGTLIQVGVFGGEGLVWGPLIGDVHGYGAEV